MNELPALFVVGKPYPKGSMTALPGGRMLPAGSAEARFNLARWKGKLQGAMLEAWQRPAYTGRVAVSIEFIVPKANREYHEKDIDKLVRCVLDEMTNARVFKDDKQVALLLTSKDDVSASEQIPGARIRVAPLELSRGLQTAFMEARLTLLV